MSSYQFHRGKFKVLARTRKSIEKFIKENGLEDKFNLENESYWESSDENYSFIEMEGKELMLVEFIEHEEGDNPEDMNYIKLNEDGSYSFIAVFYDGGTYLEEVLSDLCLKILKFEWKTKYLKHW